MEERLDSRAYQRDLVEGLGLCEVEEAQKEAGGWGNSPQRTLEEGGCNEKAQKEVERQPAEETQCFYISWVEESRLFQDQQIQNGWSRLASVFPS